jgi:fimbrial chaperone protein
MNWKSLLPTILVLMFTAGATQAFTLTPMSATFDPAGSGSAKSFRVENESSNHVDFQITMLTREITVDGGETNQPATSLFTVFPPQGTIKPGQSQTVRVIWKGDKNPTNELCFRIEGVELPINRVPEKNKAEIKVLLRYLGAVYVRPRNAKPKLQVTGFTRTPTNTYLMVVANTGNAHQPLKDPALTLTDAQGRTTKASTDQLSVIAGQNILGKHSRQFTLSLPPEYKDEHYEAQLTAQE